MPYVPDDRFDHSAVWTGSEMIVWGGVTDLFGGYDILSSGGRYDPATDRARRYREQRRPLQPHHEPVVDDLDGAGRPRRARGAHCGLGRHGDDRVGWARCRLRLESRRRALPSLHEYVDPDLERVERSGRPPGAHRRVGGLGDDRVGRQRSVAYGDRRPLLRLPRRAARLPGRRRRRLRRCRPSRRGLRWRCPRGPRGEPRRLRRRQRFGQPGCDRGLQPGRRRLRRLRRRRQGPGRHRGVPGRLRRRSAERLSRGSRDQRRPGQPVPRRAGLRCGRRTTGTIRLYELGFVGYEGPCPPP
jgi:hypothetical protein